jgi:uncharacterized repeat protein (TIGR01451 family)
MHIYLPNIPRAIVTGMALSMMALPAAAEALSSSFSFLVVETNDDGQQELVERTSVRPGEIIQYQLRHENTSADAMAGIVIAAPVPEGVSLTLGGETASIAAVFEVQAELDPEQEGLEWSTLPAMRLVANADGTLDKEPLPETEIASVRWTFSEPLKAGETALNTYRVRVD